MSNILIETYGCTLNQADSDIIESLLTGNGFKVSRGTYSPKTGAEYDFVILNTCTVKRATEQRITGRLKSMRSIGGRLVVTGCMAGANGDIITREAPEASIIKPSGIVGITEVLKKIAQNGRVEYDGTGREDKAAYLVPGGSTISRIPISEGCLSSCGFCETRHARGPLNSFSERLILKAVEASVRAGAREIQITSQDIGAYGADRKTDISELVSQAADIPGEFMIRIGMLNPEHLHKYLDGLIGVYSSSKVYKFMHLPVQSGSNRILSAMNRRYTVEEFSSHLAELRRKVSGISIETDLIVGYPSETEKEFEETVGMVESLRPTITNISKFGARPHAPASKMRQLDGKVTKLRSIRLSRIVKRMQYLEFSKAVGSKLDVLLTEANGDSVTGRTGSYIAVAVNGIGKEYIGRRVKVEITKNSYACLIGTLPDAQSRPAANAIAVPTLA